MTEISDSLQALLVRQGMRGKEAGTSALHVMGWANALLDREEGEIEPMHSPAAGEGYQPMRISGKTGDQSPRQVDRFGAVNVQDPSPAPGRPVLRLIEGSSRQRPVRYVTGPCLVLIKGGRS